MKTNKKLDDLQKSLHWLIDGLGIHGLEISDIKSIDWDWITRNYNVDMYKCEHNMEKIFTDEFLDEIGFKRQTEYESYNPITEETTKYTVKFPYGRAIDKRTNGMTVLEWNNEGASCTYFGEDLEDNVYLGIGKDGGTRMAFNGYVFDKEDVIFLLKRTW